MIRDRWTARAGWVAAGIVADLAVGELPDLLHPVARFGRIMRQIEGFIWRDSRGCGVVHTMAGASFGTVTGLALGRLIGRSGATSAAVGLAVGGRALHETADSVGQLLASGDEDGARQLLPALVGRDLSALDAKEMARAAVESVAENTVDAVVAPAIWALLAGAPGALGYRAVNTLDAMVGHRSTRYERFGWASARLDDACNWIPARLTAALVACARPHHAADVWRVVRTHAGAHPSPNAGVAEGAFAAALGLRLGGESSYDGRVEVRPALGDGATPEPGDIDAAVRLSVDVGHLLCGALLLLRAASLLAGHRLPSPGRRLASPGDCLAVGKP